ncbi:MAG: septum formation protein Maf [Chloroflexi bacterium]|uniref:dTTP/UTP pyrophosphatase n=1 Tax=Candidatus Thermofonsia Clade 3 bacterium TaxID=2364212 RepID=A0A2M8QB27_9CHLR|nr:MAG: septum formation protein Maf [Candidatus Thermofonsia Clade 3 bacterium]RMG63350.1 MAG: septum formation protein Maf [Chloroflexota bacterium]
MRDSSHLPIPHSQSSISNLQSPISNLKLSILNPQSSIVLASASPRRRELLALLGVTFQVCPADVDETPLPDETPLETQHRITREKARIARKRLEVGDCAAQVERLPISRAILNPQSPVSDPIIIACDTTVLLDGEMLNKPADADEARTMLRRLRGRAHEVQSAIVVRQGDQERMNIVSSQVTMRDYSLDEIEAYIATGDPFDKAGGYAAQHPSFQPIAQIRGCPLNVVGLALCHLRMLLPHLPDPAPVCVAFTGAPCPRVLDDPHHVVTRLTSPRGSA